MKYELQIHRRRRALAMVSQNMTRIGGGAPEGELTTDTLQGPAPGAVRGKKRSPDRISPVQYIQFSVKADWIPPTSGPVMRTMLSRHSWALRTSPAHFFETAAPPVKA